MEFVEETTKSKHTHTEGTVLVCFACLLAYLQLMSCSWIYFLSFAHWQLQTHGIIVSRENLRRPASIGTSPNKLVFCKNHTLWDFPPPPSPPLSQVRLLCHSEPLSPFPQVSIMWSSSNPSIQKSVMTQFWFIHKQQSLPRWFLPPW